MTNFKLKIASRRSKLAMVQTLWVKDQLERNIPNLEVSIEAMATQGDKILDVALAKIGDKGLFTKELEAQMLVGHADIAVHSLKDLPTNLPNGLKLGCITKREDPADALVVSKKNDCYKLETLPEGSIVGTSSLRRLAQLRNKYPHLVFKDIRGNVITRIEKLRFIAKSAQLPISLETPIGKEEDSRLGDFIEADIENPEQDVSKTLLREDLEGVLATLSPRERDVLRLRYGIDDGNENS